MSEKKDQGRASRNKGKRGELELVHYLRDRGFEVRRGKVFYGESDLVGLDGIHVEAKRTEKLNIHKAMEQSVAEAQKKGDGIPVVMFRRNRGRWMVCSFLDDWLEMYGVWVNE